MIWVKALAMLCAMSVPVKAMEVHFCWIGANGYTMDGEMSFPDAFRTATIITQDELTSFRIIGYRNEVPIGTWDMKDRTDTTTWHLRFSPAEMIFPTGGSHRGPEGQAWNANGAVNDCGNPGFGFNSGTNAQDICLNNRFITESSIERWTPFRVFEGGLGQGCSTPRLLSSLRD